MQIECNVCNTIISNSSENCPKCGAFVLRETIKAELSDVRLAINKDEILYHNSGYLEIENRPNSLVYYQDILEIKLIELNSSEQKNGKVQFIHLTKKDGTQMQFLVDGNLSRVKSVVAWINQIIGADNIISNSGVLTIHIIGGKFANSPAIIDKIYKQIVISLKNAYDLNSQQTTNIKKTISLSEVKSITREFVQKGNPNNIAFIVGVICWLGVGIYNYSFNYDSFAFISSIISGIIWGGIAWLIVRTIKKPVEIIRLITKNDELIEIKNDPVISHYFFDKDVNFTKEISVGKIESNNNEELKTNNDANRYDDLLKIKELLDKSVLTQEEFETEKKRILEK